MHFGSNRTSIVNSLDVKLETTTFYRSTPIM
jgi:hypothetical protein